MCYDDNLTSENLHFLLSLVTNQSAQHETVDRGAVVIQFQGEQPSMIEIVIGKLLPITA